MNQTEYFIPKNYLSFLIRKIKSGEAFRTVSALYSKIRKFTLISAILRITAIIVSLLEKSALLLLAFSIIFLMLPIIVLSIICYSAICVFRYFALSKEINKWLSADKNTVVFITKEHILSNSVDKLFISDAKAAAKKHKNAVIIVCRDPILAAKWLSPNLLAVSEDYFFILRRFYIEKKRLDVTYIVL